MLEAKDIFIPRNSERYEDIKKPYIGMGYKPEEIHVGSIIKNINKLKGIKVVVGDVGFNGDELYFYELEIVTGIFAIFNCHLTHHFRLPKIVGDNVYWQDNNYYPLNHMDPFFCKRKVKIGELNSEIEKFSRIYGDY